MKKRIWSILLSGLLAAVSLMPMARTISADSEKVVTLGADLDEAQKESILRYFGILGQNVRTITITNQDERDHLASYVPIEQIGTRTFSCALVRPTSSGGIRVRTANLNWVTGNMIASTLSTSGVKNCEVIAAAPFEVSGTGALTGVIMAYEDASGTSLDPTKKDVAAQELVTTTTLANTVGQTQATNIVNEIKIEIIEQQETDPVRVENIVENVIINEPEAVLSETDRELLNDLANRIAQQQYDYDEMKETLERVEQNVNANADINVDTDANIDSDVNVETDVNAESDVEADVVEETDAGSPDGESIMDAVDESVFGYDVVTSTTEEPAEEVPPEPEQQETAFEEPAPEEPVQLPTDSDSVMILPIQNTDGSGNDELLIRVAADDVVPAPGNDGSFGRVIVSGPMGGGEIFLQDASDPSAYDEVNVTVKRTDDHELEAAGWIGGTDICINLGMLFAFEDDPAAQYTIEIRNLTLVQRNGDGTENVIDVLNKLIRVYMGENGLEYEVSDFPGMPADDFVSE